MLLQKLSTDRKQDNNFHLIFIPMRILFFFLMSLLSCTFIIAQENSWKKLDLKGRVKKMTDYSIDKKNGERRKRDIVHFDERGMLTRKEVLYTNGFVLFYGYDSLLRKISMKRVRDSGKTDAEDHWSYDSKNRLIKEINDRKDDTGYNRIFLYTYDPAGREILFEERGLDNSYRSHKKTIYRNDSAFSTSYERGFISRYKEAAYDSLGHELWWKIRDRPDGYYFFEYRSTYDSLGREIKKTAYAEDGFWHEFIYEYDSLGEQVRWIYHNDLKKPPEIHVYEHVYDQAGNLIRLTCKIEGEVSFINEYEYEYFEGN